MGHTMSPAFSRMTSRRTGDVPLLPALPCPLTSLPGSAQPADILFWPARLDYWIGSWSRSVSVADFNRDELPDLVTGFLWSNQVAVLQGRGWLALAATSPTAAPASITFVLPETGRIRLWVVDEGRRLAAALLDRLLILGTHHVVWDLTGNDGHCMRAGMHFVTLEAAGRHAAQQVIVVQ